MKDLFEICGECRHLSDAEIVYQITNSEKTAKSVKQMLMQSDRVTIEDICQQLTPARKEMALAVIELYRRLQDREKNFSVIQNSNDIFKVMRRYLSGLDHEECWAIYLSQASKIIKKQRISSGGLASTSVDIRLVIREAILTNATSVILIHNHPSGNTRPSIDDDRLTQSLSQAAKALNIRMLDHVIFSDVSHYSYADEGRL